MNWGLTTRIVLVFTSVVNPPALLGIAGRRRNLLRRVKQKMMSQSPIFSLAAIFLLRFFGILTMGSFWFDEMFSFHFAQYDLSKMFSYLQYETNPFLHIFLLHFWLKIFGASELTARLFSLVCGLLSVFVIYLLGKKMFSKRAGFFAALLVGFSSLQIFHSAEARTYGLVVLLSLTVVYFLWRLREKSGSLLLWLLYAIASILLVYAHLTGFLMVVIANLFVMGFYLVKKEKFLSWRFWLTGQAIIVFSFSLWFVPNFLRQLTVPKGPSWYFGLPYSSNFIGESLRDFLIAGNEWMLIDLLVKILLITSLVAVFVSGRRNSAGRVELNFKVGKENIFLALWLFLPLLIGFILGVDRLRFWIIASPALYLLMAKGLADLTARFKKDWLIGIVIICLLSPVDLQALAKIKIPWQEVADYVEQQERSGDVVIAHSFIHQLTLSHYYHGQLAIKGFYPLTDNDDHDLRIVKHNWHVIVSEENVGKLADYTAGSQRVFLVIDTGALDPNNLVLEWFWQNGWRLVEHEILGRENVVEIYLLAAD